MIGRIAFVAVAAMFCLLPQAGRAQDVPGIEICTVEKTMERRTSCLQSNVDFLQKTTAKLALDNQRRIDAANRQIDGLKAAVASLEKLVEEQKKAIEDLKKPTTPPAKDAAPAAKEGAK
jgi:flagellar motility protein MotE (MotC chaperone)